MRVFARQYGIKVFDAGEGICHQLLIESGIMSPGNLVMGADSHTCTYGALGVFSTGVGSTDLAAAMATGKSWFKVPETLRIDLIGTPPEHTYGKDIILHIIGRLTADGATYKSVEFYGSWLDEATLATKMTIANMVSEMGGKCCFICDKGNGLASDPGAVYSDRLEVNLAAIGPMVACPYTVDNVRPVEIVVGTVIQQAVIGSCTNGRHEDLAIAADILDVHGLHPDVRLYITPASRTVLLETEKSGVLARLIRAGAILTSPGCGSCVGTLGGIPGDNENVISCTNRNFKGRMGNPKAPIYLASPATVALSAAKGAIADPRARGK
jgi:3-isopropylmalate/(R)-2-methylmalate dehydratase large subunit